MVRLGVGKRIMQRPLCTTRSIDQELRARLKFYHFAESARIPIIWNFYTGNLCSRSGTGSTVIEIRKTKAQGLFGLEAYACARHSDGVGKLEIEGEVLVGGIELTLN
ncbi:unnamed protein product [Blepharisma stoltei]|uniref:Uncharacterized protein n=1 Tax=Blepharisma stoltei TaxID=1481888 RepID=A0AAU9K1P6_9CILI|nr:unnamed protein product [Blepharisma stoltei]